MGCSTWAVREVIHAARAAGVAVLLVTGLHQVLRTLRLSEHSAVAVGDAENDHAPLDACGLPARRSPGAAPPCAPRPTRSSPARDRRPWPTTSVAWSRGRVFAAERARSAAPPARTAATAKEPWLAVRGRNVLVAGDPHSGKSYLAGLLAEARGST